MRHFLPLLRRFRRDDRGVFAVFFALLALVLIATAGAVVDFTYVQEARTEAQTAMDAAALALQSRISTDNNATLVSKAQSILTKQISDSSITATVTNVTTDTSSGTISIRASVTVPTAFIRMVGITSLRSNMLSEVTQGSKNVEVAVALDITGSMAGTKLANLQSATNTLIDLVVKTTQTPTYSKMSIIPWSNSINVGSYATNIRGAESGPVNISNVRWASSSVNVSGVTKANPAVVTTSAAHGFSTGDTVYLANISGMTEINNNSYTITWLSSTTFSLNGVDSRNYSRYSNSSSDKAYRCVISSCELTVTTSSAHGLSSGDEVYISGVSGTTSANNSDMYNPWTVGTVVSSTIYSLDGATGPGSSIYTRGGTSQCLALGCSYYKFTNNWYGGTNVWTPSTCVSERTTNPYTSDPPSSYPLGFVYADGGNNCPSASLLPLTSNITTLKSTVTTLTAGGSTAGHLGVAWGWYMVSPDFAYLWPSSSQPAAFNASTLVKAVVLMTDGDFNTQYCNGVISADAGSGSGSSSDHINCNAPNGSSESQFLSICANIKAQNIILYTVGFDMAGNTAAATRLTNCATDSAHYFQADTGTDLTNAFRQIAQNLNNLRVSK